MVNVPTSTYRVQMKPGEFTFSDLAAQAQYLQKLGVGTVYMSPINQNHPKSDHGYWITDYNSVWDTLGGLKGFMQLRNQTGLGIMLDFVPNHMFVEGPENAWWYDVLEKGRDSEHAAKFDIYWEEAGNKIRVPFFGPDPEEDFKLAADKDSFFLDYWGTRYPLGVVPVDLPDLKKGDPESFLDVFNSDQENVKKLLAAQHYEPIFWKQAFDPDKGINYRTFFTITQLAALMMEKKSVFNDAHALMRELLPYYDSLREDHVDALRFRTSYLKRIRSLIGSGKYLVLEKILARGEQLPSSFNKYVQGTTGYDAMEAITGAFVRNMSRMEQVYRSFMGPAYRPYEIVLHDSRIEMLDTELKNALYRHARTLEKIAKAEKKDFDFERLVSALKEISAGFDVYRTDYGDVPFAESNLISVVNRAAERAHSWAPELKPEIEFAKNVLTFNKIKDLRMAETFVLDYQQFTGSVVAKGTEDTAFFRHMVLLAANEVGFEPDKIVYAKQEILDFIVNRSKTTMNALSTHDSKMGEDTRARGAAISHDPGAWASVVQQMHKYLGQSCISSLDEYRFYQTLISSMPLDFIFGQGLENPDAYINMLARIDPERPGALIKYAREAKLETNWLDKDNPQEKAYEEALSSFVGNMVHDKRFMHSQVLPYARRIAHVGANISLVQKAIQMTMPGVPDNYQGCETWSFTLLDPWNRDTPDYDVLRSNLESCLEDGWAELSLNWTDGKIKQRLTHDLLNLRKNYSELFLKGDTLPIDVLVDGKESNDYLAFARGHDGQAVILVVPLSYDGLNKDKLGLEGEVSIRLPDSIKGSLKDLLYKTELENPDHVAFKDIPLAILGVNL